MAHYSVQEVRDIGWLRSFFREDTDMDLNWLLLSTSGVHGTGHTLDDIESGQTDNITVLVIQPRLVCIRYGNIDVSPEDIPWLRQLVAKSLKVMAESQVGNLLRKEADTSC